MADINPLALIGKSNIAPDEPGRKAAADLQRGLAQITLQNRGQLDNSRLVGDTQRDVAAIGQGFANAGALDPTELGRIRKSKRGLRHAQTIGQSAPGGVRVPKGEAFDIGEELPLVKPGFDLPGEAEAKAAIKGDSKKEVTDVQIVIGDDGVPRKRTIKDTTGVSVKFDDPRVTKFIREKIIDKFGKSVDPSTIQFDGKQITADIIQPNGTRVPSVINGVI